MHAYFNTTLCKVPVLLLLLLFACFVLPSASDGGGSVEVIAGVNNGVIDVAGACATQKSI